MLFSLLIYCEFKSLDLNELTALLLYYFRIFFSLSLSNFLSLLEKKFLLQMASFSYFIRKNTPYFRFSIEKNTPYRAGNQLFYHIFSSFWRKNTYFSEKITDFEGYLLMYSLQNLCKISSFSENLAKNL